MSTATQLSTQHTQRLTAGFAALAICIHLFESSLPSLLGIKPGLANIITLIVLLRYGLRMAVQVQLLRVFIASLLNGSLFSPTFFLSLSGSLAALLGLSLVYVLVFRIGGKKPGLPISTDTWQPGAISFSVIAALANMCGQFLLAYAWLIPHAGLFKLLPFLLLIALAFGWVNGIISHHVLHQLDTPLSTPDHA